MLEKKTSNNIPQIPDHPYKVLIFGGSGTRERNTLFNLISGQPHIDKMYLYAEDLFGAN